MSARVLEQRSKEERDRLIEQYLPLVHHVVGRLVVTLPPGLERDDLFSAGVLGLMHAARSYDETKGATFKTYAFTTVRGAILDELRRQDPIPRSARERLRRLDAANRGLTAEHGRPATRDELCEALGCSPEELDEDYVNLQVERTLSLHDGGDEHEALADSIVGDEPSPAQVLEHKEALEILGEEITRLPPQACQVVILYYHEGLLLKEIGQVLGVSESRVCQILSKALARLRLALQR
ncbi:MAG: FliA/WhiG family RNA polymerase sigma factor [Planctomycetota bacterium]